MTSRSILALLSLLLGSLVSVSDESQTPQFDVLINGQLSVDKGQRTPALAGRVLRGPGYKKPTATP